jgi:deoxycytidine triphosphate deaminase
VPYEPPYDLDEVAFFDAGELERRAAFFKSADPFEDIPPALLSSEHICDYVRVTGMIHPFYPLKSRLKAASYQVRAKRYVRWKDDGEKHVEEVRPGSIHALPPNSITFVQLESAIRLPDYIAMRLHLDGALAQRGLLLGPGPFIEPAAGGDLLVPLHNLTSQSYSLNAEDGVVWIEFAKTSHSKARRPAQRRVFHAADDASTRASPGRDAGSAKGDKAIVDKASVDNPVQSSIPVAIRDATGRAEARSARQAKWAAGVLAVIGVLTIAGAVYATMLTLQLHFEKLNADVVAANSLAAAAAKEAAAATQKSELLTRELAESRLALVNLQAEIARIREEVKAKPEPAQASPAPPPPARSTPVRQRRPRR